MCSTKKEKSLGNEIACGKNENITFIQCMKTYVYIPIILLIIFQCVAAYSFFGETNLFRADPHFSNLCWPTTYSN